MDSRQSQYCPKRKEKTAVVQIQRRFCQNQNCRQRKSRKKVISTFSQQSSDRNSKHDHCPHRCRLVSCQSSIKHHSNGCKDPRRLYRKMAFYQHFIKPPSQNRKMSSRYGHDSYPLRVISLSIKSLHTKQSGNCWKRRIFSVSNLSHPCRFHVAGYNFDSLTDTLLSSPPSLVLANKLEKGNPVSYLSPLFI